MLSLCVAAMLSSQVVEFPPLATAPGLPIIARPSKLDGGKSVKYVALDQGITVVPSGLLKSEDTLFCFAPTAGVYRVLAVCAKGDVPSDPCIITITVGTGPGPGPPPGPQPGPGPGPGPQPGPVVPSDPKADPLWEPLSSMAGALKEPGQDSNLAKLSRIYSQGATAATTAGTFGEWSNAMREASRAEGMAPTVLLPIRERLQDELKTTLGDNATAAMTGGLGAKTAALCKRVSAILALLSKGGA